MINHLNTILRALLKSQVASLQAATSDHIGFVPPDGTWSGYVRTLARKAVNVYLVDVRENRKLRSNERRRTEENGVWTEEPPPHRVDCHYLISAWSPAHPFNHQAQQDEHEILGEVLAVLLEYDPLKPSSVPGLAQGAIPDAIWDADLPTQVAPAEGFPKLVEFWGAMGTGHRWKPAIYLIVTLPVVRSTREIGGMVTTCITRYLPSKGSDQAEVWIQIGGRVLDTTQVPPEPVAEARVDLADASSQLLQTTESDALGRFSFDGLAPGTYHLQAQAAGFSPVAETFQVPSPTGDYDLHLT